MKTPHTGVYSGKRVLVIFRDGGKIIDRFVERSQKFIWLKDYGKVAKNLVRSLSIYKK